MKQSIEAFRTWAPDDAPWSAWAKPVLFADPPSIRVLQDETEPEDAPMDWIKRVPPRAMLIVDLPGKQGVDEGLALARRGYRPVPLYNGVLGPANCSVVGTRDVAVALFRGAKALAGIEIRPDATPAFLLDANRMSGAGKRAGTFDNRWCVFPQDMPSAAFALAQGIGDAVVRSEHIQSDLAHILRRYQDAGIRIWQCRRDQSIKQRDIPKPPRFRSALYRFGVMAGLRRNAAGGFGEMIPEPHQGGGYHGFG